ncbi:unnamed protein product [Ophioblennius macclurei]
MSHSSLPSVGCPDEQTEPGCSTTCHTSSSSDNTVLQSGGSASPFCTFCDQTVTLQDELDSHISTTVLEPSMLLVEENFSERPGLEPSGLPVEKEEVHSCIICGQVSEDVSELTSHMRKHKEHFPYGCDVCERRYRDPRYLANHMKMHAKARRRHQAKRDSDPPVTINGVVQEPPLEPVVTSYEMCLACGFFFPDHDSLAEHSQVYHRDVQQDEGEQRLDDVAESRELFLRATESHLPVRTSKWIPQLNPVVTYRAWQLATKGKVAASYRREESVKGDAEETGFVSIFQDEDRFNRSTPRPREHSDSGKLLKSDDDLTVNEKTHTDEKPYKCVFCNYAAARRTSLKCHVDRCHGVQTFMRTPSRPWPSASTESDNTSVVDSASQSQTDLKEPARKRKRTRFAAPAQVTAGSMEELREPPTGGSNGPLETGTSVRRSPRGTGLPVPSEALSAQPHPGAG